MFIALFRADRDLFCPHLQQPPALISSVIMSSGLDLDDFDALPAANQEARSRSATPVLNIRSKPTKKKHVPRYLGDDDDDDLTNLDALFNDLDDVPDVLPPPPKLKRSRADGPADDNTWQGGEIGAADEEGDGGKQKKARLPRAKMDETRLLGPNGFPKLKEQAKKFKVGKKGNEVRSTLPLSTILLEVFSLEGRFETAYGNVPTLGAPNVSSNELHRYCYSSGNAL